MKFTLKGPFKENVYILMRKTGYYFRGKFAEANASSHASAKTLSNDEIASIWFPRVN